MEDYKRLIPLLVLLWVVVLTGCIGVKVQPTVMSTDNRSASMVATPVLRAGDAANQQPTDLPAIVSTTVLASPAPTSVPQDTLSQGKVLADSVCIVCHIFDRISNSHKSRDEWVLTVKRMVDHGAPLNDEQQLSVIEYLSMMYK
jgi:hypothetical protein